MPAYRALYAILCLLLAVSAAFAASKPDADKGHGKDAHGKDAHGKDKGGHGAPAKVDLGPPLPIAPPAKIYSLVRALRVEQDRAILGATDARQKIRARVSEIAQAAATADAETWNDRRNARALAAFALAGGNPDVVRGVLGTVEFEGDEDRLVRGALSYAEGRTGEANALLGSFDARNLDPLLAGHIALAQSALVSGKDRDAGLARLDEARLLAPGSMIEDAALRRQSLLLLETGQLERFERTAARYMRRFWASVFAENFRTRFVSGVVASAYATDDVALRRLGAVLDSLAPKQRREMYLSLAEAAVLGGRVRLIRFSAEEASRLAAEGSVDRTRSNVYAAAAFVVSDEIDRGLELLRGLDRSHLSRSDEELADAALALAAAIRRWPGIDAMASLPKAADTPPESRARRTIDDIDFVLKGDDG